MLPGDALHKALTKLDYHITEDCDCWKHIQQMNAWGKKECFKRLDEITGWLIEESINRNLTTPPRFMVRAFVALAIRKSE